MAAWRNRHKHFFARVMTSPELLAEAPRINLKSSAIRKVAVRNFQTAADLESDRTRHGAISWSILATRSSAIDSHQRACTRFTHCR